MQKSKKNFKKKAPWYAFDCINEDKGWWKIFFRRQERVQMKRDTYKEYKSAC